MTAKHAIIEQPFLGNGLRNNHTSTVTRECSNNERDILRLGVLRCYKQNRLEVGVSHGTLGVQSI
jgi:hypothetical protein